MAEPSAFVAAIVSRLGTLLGSGITVEASDGTFLGKDHITVAHATVLVACLRMPIDHELGMEPPVTDGEFVAFCIASHPVGAKGEGDVAMDLAALVASHVYREDWRSTAYSRASRVRCLNMHTRGLKDDGLSIWAVHWTQPFELTPPDLEGILHRLAQINTTYAMGDEDTPDVAHTIDFPDPEEESP